MSFIDRDKALSFPFANGQYDHENADEHFIFGCETYREWLETLPILESGWIPCNVKYPREDRLYLVTVGGKYSRNTSVAGFYHGEWHSIFRNEKMDNVFAWMPLPKPYEVKDE